MKFYEFIQRAGNGGFPIPNGESGFTHGDAVFVVKKRELLSLLYRVIPIDEETRKEIEELLKEDTFVARSPDLPGDP